MEGIPENLSGPENVNVVSQFTDFVLNLEKNNAMGGGVFWTVAVEELLQNQDINPSLESVYQNEGLAAMKAHFIAELYRLTDAKNIGNIEICLRKIINFEA